MLPASEARASAQSAVFCFSVHADNDVSVLPNVAGALAKRSLIPDRMVSTLLRQDDGELQIDFQVNGLNQATAELLAQAIRRMMCTRVVLTSEK